MYVNDDYRYNACAYMCIRAFTDLFIDHQNALPLLFMFVLFQKYSFNYFYSNRFNIENISIAKSYYFECCNNNYYCFLRC